MVDRDAGTDAGAATTTATDSFIDHRNLLFTVAYEMLGSAADAEDVLQETWLRWSGVEHTTVRDPRAFLVRITTRQSLTRLRTLRRRKESYVGPWLPEPLLIAPDVAEDVELADSVSMAMLLVLETLAPTERAVFVLRDVFDLDYDEEVGHGCGEHGHLAQEEGYRAVHVGRVERAETAVDAGRAGAVQDEQQPREERVVTPPLLLASLDRLRRAAPADGRRGVLVELGVGAEFGREAFGAHGRPVDLEERPQHRTPPPSRLLRW
ncbi:RNA polymerase subunit sigma-24 [Streptomyces sp. NBC_00016]|uniref:sigma factor n=1 Tax=Streptomyces sp. NBC_00016 TaxID=2975622 RepID=UPI003243B66B